MAIRGGAKAKKSAVDSRKRVLGYAGSGKGLPTPERALRGRIIDVPATATDGEPAQAGARVRRTQTPVERYVTRGLITNRQASAALTFRDDYEFGIAGVTNSDKGTGSGGVTGLTDAQLDAATAYKLAARAVGPRLSAIVIPIALGDPGGGDITAEQLANNTNNRNQVMAILRVGLDTLADHYSQSSNRARAARYR